MDCRENAGRAGNAGEWVRLVECVADPNLTWALFRRVSSIVGWGGAYCIALRHADTRRATQFVQESLKSLPGHKCYFVACRNTPLEPILDAMMWIRITAKHMPPLQVLPPAPSRSSPICSACSTRPASDWISTISNLKYPCTVDTHTRSPTRIGPEDTLPVAT